jgi:hypothetical protein
MTACWQVDLRRETVSWAEDSTSPLDEGYGICINTEHHYFEHTRIVEQCHTYLRRMMRNWRERRHVMYLDETWMNTHDGKDKAWV